MKSEADQLDAYREAVSTVTRTLGHSGRDVVDLLDAIAQLETLLSGEDLDRNDLTGLAEQLRVALAAVSRTKTRLVEAKQRIAELEMLCADRL